jgi:hypothetical protein
LVIFSFVCRGVDQILNRSLARFIRPRFAGAEKYRVLATLMRPSFGYDHARKRFTPRKKGGGAPKGALSWQLPLARLRATLEGALAFRRLTAAFTIGYHPDGSAPEPGFLKARRTRCFAGSPHTP